MILVRVALLVALSLGLAIVGFGLAVGEASACRVSVGAVCVVPGSGGGGCDDSGCYPCDPRPGHPLDC